MAVNPSVAILSFEGPDGYSMVGGLGTRVTELAHALAEARRSTDLFFVGDPALPAVEEPAEGVRYRRWCQWISAYHPAGVYDGEGGKVDDFSASVPPFVVDDVVAPAAQRGERALILAEEWQTVRATIAIEALLRARGLRHAATILWNANNTYGFDGIDWPALAAACTITTISRYMKFEMARYGQQPLIIPNGIPRRLLDGPPAELIDGWRTALGGRPLLVKVGRFDPDKRWMQAIDAVAELREWGARPQLIIRGGREPYGEEVLAHARTRGLRVGEVSFSATGHRALFERLSASHEDVVVLRAFLAPELLYALYHAADAVLANSGKEPFGLVGLEVMAAGGLAVCGATGEEYAEPFVNAIVVDTDDGRELAEYLRDVAGDSAACERLRACGKETVARFTWDRVIELLDRKVEFAAQLQGGM